MEGQPEATFFYLETPSNARELAEEIAKIALNQLKEKLNDHIKLYPLYDTYQHFSFD